MFTPIRELFSATQEARSRGYKPGRFSFNVKGGRCEACQGDGLIKVEMHFLPDIYVMCDVCKGKRYNRETLQVRYKGKNIHEILEMTVEDAREFFSAVPIIARKLQTLMDVGLAYIRLGQNATTLSGGEAQRVKLSRELSKRDTGKTLYILDEPTTGLHFHDVKQLLGVLHQLRDHGNTVVVIEHNLDVIKTADWIIDLGPEGGDGGGEIIASGTPEDVARQKNSYTGRFLAPVIRKHGAVKPAQAARQAELLQTQLPGDAGLMTALICGSFAYDRIMVYPGRFRDDILPDKIHILNVCFVVPELQQEFGGSGGNIIYNTSLLGADCLPMGTVGTDFAEYREWLEQNAIDTRHIRVIDDTYTAQCFITTDMDDKPDHDVPGRRHGSLPYEQGIHGARYQHRYRRSRRQARDVAARPPIRRGRHPVFLRPRPERDAADR